MIHNPMFLDLSGGRAIFLSCISSGGIGNALFRDLGPCCVVHGALGGRDDLCRMGTPEEVANRSFCRKFGWMTAGILALYSSKVFFIHNPVFIFRRTRACDRDVDETKR